MSSNLKIQEIDFDLKKIEYGSGTFIASEVDTSIFRYPGLLVKLSSEAYASLDLEAFKKGQLLLTHEFFEYQKLKSNKILAVSNLSLKLTSSFSYSSKRFFIISLLSETGLDTETAFLLEDEYKETYLDLISLLNNNRKYLVLPENFKNIEKVFEYIIKNPSLMHLKYVYDSELKKKSPPLAQIQLLNDTPLIYYAEASSAGLKTSDKFYEVSRKDFEIVPFYFEKKGIHVFLEKSNDSALFSISSKLLKKTKIYVYLEGDAFIYTASGLFIEALKKSSIFNLKKEEAVKKARELLKKELNKKKRSF